MNLSISDFYRICRNAVIFSPPTSPVKPCLQLQAFRVLQRDPRTNSEIGTDTLGAVPTDKGMPFFWSRKWSLAKSEPGGLSYGYPLLTAFEIINETDSAIFQGKASRTYTIELSVLDSFRPELFKGKVTACDGRPINQIFLDTEYLLDSALKYIGGSVIATTTGDPRQKVYYKPFLDAVMPGNYTSVLDVGQHLGGINQSLRFARVEYPVKNIFGTKVQIKFKAQSCPTIDFTTAVPDLDKIGFEAGCQDC